MISFRFIVNEINNKNYVMAQYLEMDFWQAVFSVNIIDYFCFETR